MSMNYIVQNRDIQNNVLITGNPETTYLAGKRPHCGLSAPEVLS